MSDVIKVAIISLIGTVTGSLLGILASNKLTIYRIQQLENKVDKHNSLIERTYKLEGQVTEVIHDIKEIKGDLKK